MDHSQAHAPGVVPPAFPKDVATADQEGWMRPSSQKASPGPFLHKVHWTVLDYPDSQGENAIKELDGFLQAINDSVHLHVFLHATAH